MFYTVTLDEDDSWIETNIDPECYTFEEACQEIIEYCEYSGYIRQAELWKVILQNGEEMYITATPTDEEEY